MKNTILAYTAGIIDGEGCITTSGDKGFRICVSNTDIKMLNYLQENFGGRINSQHLPENPKWSKAWKWVLCSQNKVLQFLYLITPYLVCKKSQAEIVLAHLQKYLIHPYAKKKIHRNHISQEQKDSFILAKNRIRAFKTHRL